MQGAGGAQKGQGHRGAEPAGWGPPCSSHVPWNIGLFICEPQFPCLPNEGGFSLAEPL